MIKVKPLKFSNQITLITNKHFQTCLNIVKLKIQRKFIL
jgi:hypothetical protein